MTLRLDTLSLEKAIRALKIFVLDQKMRGRSDWLLITDCYTMSWITLLSYHTVMELL